MLVEVLACREQQDCRDQLAQLVLQGFRVRLEQQVTKVTPVSLDFPAALVSQVQLGNKDRQDQLETKEIQEQVDSQDKLETRDYQVPLAPLEQQGSKD